MVAAFAADVAISVTFAVAAASAAAASVAAAAVAASAPSCPFWSVHEPRRPRQGEGHLVVPAAQAGFALVRLVFWGANEQAQKTSKREVSSGQRKIAKSYLLH